MSKHMVRPGSLHRHARAKRDWRRRGWRCGFELLEPLRMLNAVSWIGPATGATWNTTADWSGLSAGETAPGPTDDVTISGNVTVTHNSGTDQINTLTIGTGATLAITGGSTITLEVGNGTAVTDDGAIDLGDAAGTSAGNLIFNGNQTLAVTSGDSGTVVLGGNGFNTLSQSSGGQSLTIGTGITIQAGDGTVGNSGGTLANQGTMNADAAGTIRVLLGTGGSNSGTIEVTSSAATLTVAGPGLQAPPSNTSAQWTNSGTISASGGTLNIDDTQFDPWINTGTIASTGATVNLDGLFSQTDLGTFTRDAASTANLSGDLIGNLALDSGTGSWDLAGGQLGAPPIGSTTGGGTLSTSGASTLVGTRAGGTLDGVTLDGTLDLTTVNGAAADVQNGLILGSGSLVEIGNPTNFNLGILAFVGPAETLSGTGTLRFGNSAGNSLGVGLANGATLTIGAGITIDGQNGTIGFVPNVSAGTPFINQGTIDADGANGTSTPATGGVLTIDDNGWSNAGSISASGGNNLTLFGFTTSSTTTGNNPAWTNQAGATIDMAGGGTLSLVGVGAAPTSGPSLDSNWLNLGTVTAAGSIVDFGDREPNEAFTLAALGTFNRTGGTVNIESTLTNNDANETELVLDGNAAVNSVTGTVFTEPGSWVLAAGGSIVGGTVVTQNGAVLQGGGGAPGLLDGVTLDGALDLATINGAITEVQGGLTLASGSLIEIGNPTNFNVGTLAFVGPSETLGGTGAVRFGNSAFNSLGVGLASGATLTIGAGITIDGQNGSIGVVPNVSAGTPFINQGTIDADGANGTSTPATGGTITVNSGNTNFTGGVLTGGTWQASAGGTLRLLGDAITSDAADITVDGATSNVFSDNTGSTNALAGLASIAAGGSLALLDGYALATSGGLANNGTLTLGTGSAAASALTTNGNYTQASAATLDVQLGGTPASGLFGQLKANGATSGAALAGTLNASLVNGFTPLANEAFPLITTGAANGLTGTFGTVHVPSLSGGLAFSPRYNANNFTLATTSTVVPTKLVFLQQPSNTAAGQAIDGTAGVQVEIVDQSGHVITGDNSTVTITIASGPSGAGFTSTSTLSVQAVKGVATFSNLVLDTAGSYTLSASDSTDSLPAVQSNSFNVVPAAASQLVFTAQPANLLVGQTIDGTSGVQVSIEDPFGNVETGDTSSVTIGIASPAGGTFASGTLTKGAVAGVATFNDLVIDTAGSYTLSAADAAESLSGFNSKSFSVNAAAASQLVFTAQPTNTATGQTINGTSGVQVAIEDQFGNVEMGDTSSVTIGIASPAGGTFASGTLTVAAVAGVATFNDLVIDTPGTYTLSANATDNGVTLAGATSNSFGVALPGSYLWTGQGSDDLWTDLSNWQQGGQTPTVLPGAADTVFIPAVVTKNNFPLLQSGFTVTVESITDNGPLTLQGTLELPFSGTPDLTGSGSVFFQGGILEDAHVGAATTLLGSIEGGTLQDVTADGLVDLATNNGATLDVLGVAGLQNNGIGSPLFVQGGLTLGSGALVSIGNAGGSTQGKLVFEGNGLDALGTLGTATVRFGGSGGNVVGIGTELDIGPGITIDGQNGLLVGPTGLAAGNPFSNFGVIAADGANGSTTPGSGGTITIDATGWTNEGAIEATGGNNLVLTGDAENSQGIAWTNDAGATISVTGDSAGSGTLTLNGLSNSVTGDSNWLNLGTISLDDATLDLGDGQGASGDVGEQFTLAALGDFQRTGGTVVIQSTLTNSGDVMLLDGSAAASSNSGSTFTEPGSWIVGDGGQIVGGLVQTVDGAALIGGAQGGTIGVLDGIALNGTLNLSQNVAAVNAVNVRDGLTLVGGSQVLIGNQSGTSSGELLFSGPQEEVATPADLAGEHLGVPTVVNAAPFASFIHTSVGGTSGGTSGGAAGANTQPATITFGANGGNLLSASLESNATLTIGAHIVVDGKNGDVGGLPGGGAGTPLNVLGTISADGSSGAGKQTQDAERLIGIGGGPPPAGTLTVDTTDLVNYVQGFDHLNGGTWEAANGNTLRLLGVNIKDNNASIILDGPTSRILSDSGTTSALAGLYFIDFGGSLSLLDGARLATPGFLGNNGSLTIGTGATTASVLTVNGEYGQFGGGSLTFQIGGPPGGSLFGVLDANGSVFLNGTLNIDEANGFIPLGQDSYRVINAGIAVGGQFATFNGQVPGEPLGFAPQYNSNNVTLVAQLLLQVMEGSSFTLPLAVFDQSTTFTQADVDIGFAAQIDWGDGATTSANLYAGSQPNPAATTANNLPPFIGQGITVEGPHTYQEQGDYPLEVTIFKLSTVVIKGITEHLRTVLFQLPGIGQVAEAPLETDIPGVPTTNTAGVSTNDFFLNSSPVTGSEGQALAANTIVGEFVDLNPFAQPGDFNPEIDWGDGSTTIGTVTTFARFVPSNPPAFREVFAVEGGHTYAEAGAYHIVVTVAETHVAHSEQVVDQQTSIDRAAQIADVPLTAGPSLTLTGTEGVALGESFAGVTTSVPLGTFTDANIFAQPGDFTASIDWGDGQTSSGTVTLVPLKGFGVFGGHTYTDEGQYNITITVHDRGGSQVTLKDAADIADVVLTTQAGLEGSPVQGIHPTALQKTPFNGPVIDFIDVNLSDTAANFRATIDWGDGSTATPGQVQLVPGGVGGLPPILVNAIPFPGAYYEVVGQHTYNGTSSGFPITVDVFDGNNETVFTNTMLVPTFAQVVQGIENGFTTLAGNLNTDIFNNPVPLVGQGLGPFVTQIFQGFINAVNQAQGSFTAAEQQNYSALTIATLLYDAFGPSPGLGLLQLPAGEQFDAKTGSPILGQDPSNGEAEFDIPLTNIPVSTGTATVSLTSVGTTAFSFGLPGIPFKSNGTGDVDVSLGYTLNLAITSVGDNDTFDIVPPPSSSSSSGSGSGSGSGSSSSSSGPQDSQLTLDVQANIPSHQVGGVNSPVPISGTMGLLPVTLTDTGSAFNGFYTIPLKGQGVGSAGAATPSLETVKGFPASSGFQAATENFFITPSIESALPPEIPSIGAAINVSWSIGNPAPPSGSSDKPNPMDLLNFGTALGETPTVTFSDFSINLGTLFGPAFEQIVQQIQRATKPVGGLISDLEQPVPVLDQIFGLIGQKGPTWLDLLSKLLLIFGDSQQQVQTDVADLGELNSVLSDINNFTPLTANLSNGSPTSGNATGGGSNAGLVYNYGTTFNTKGDPRATGYNADGTPSGGSSFAIGSQTSQSDFKSTTTTLSAAPNPDTSGGPVTFTATVSLSSTATGTPTGTVAFDDGTTLLGTAGLSPVPGSNGQLKYQAKFTASSLTDGPHSITAAYQSNTPQFEGSTSAAVQLVVGSGPAPSPPLSLSALLSPFSYQAADGTTQKWLDFPMIDNAATALGMLLGKTEPIFQLNLPQLPVLNVPVNLPPVIIPTPIPGILINLNFSGSLGVGFQGIIGFDTEGLTDGNLLDGLFIDDLGFTFEASINASAQVSAAEIVSVGAGANLALNLDVSLAPATVHTGFSGPSESNEEPPAQGEAPGTDPDLVLGSDLEDPLHDLKIEFNPSIQAGANINVSVGPFGIIGSWSWGIGITVPLPGFSIGPQGDPPGTTDIWTGQGQDDNWTDAANWYGGVAPSPGDNLDFPAVALQQNNFDDFPNGTKFASLTFGGSYLVNGSALTIGAGGITGTGVNTTTIDNSITLSADPTFTALDPGTTLVFNGGVNTAGLGLVFDGDGSSVLNGPVSGGGSVTKQGNGQLLLGAADTYSGGTNIEDGTVLPSQNQSLGSGDVTLQPSGNLLATSGAANLVVPTGGYTVSSTEGEDSGPQGVATFTNAGGPTDPADYSATINWGDGTTTTAGTIAFNTASGAFTVTGDHTYAQDSASAQAGSGPYTIAVAITQSGGPALTVFSSATVAEPAITGAGVTASGFERSPLANVVLATFTHGAGTDAIGDFSATVDWGDGTTSTAIVAQSGTTYTVTGSHTYLDEGTYPVTIDVTDDAAAATFTASADCREELLPGGKRGTPNERFIAEVYRDLLHRAVDASGLTFWSQQLDQGRPRLDVVQEIIAASLPHELGADLVTGLYEKYLGRRPDAAGLAFWTGRLAGGQTSEQVAAQLVASQEFFAAAGGSNDGFLGLLFQKALHRPLDAAGQTFFDAQLTLGASRGQVALEIFDSDEYHRLLVSGFYQAPADPFDRFDGSVAFVDDLSFLGRPADTAGVAFWAKALDQGATDEQVMAALMASDEFFAKNA